MIRSIEQIRAELLGIYHAIEFDSDWQNLSQARSAILDALRSMSRVADTVDALPSETASVLQTLQALRAIRDELETFIASEANELFIVSVQPALFSVSSAISWVVIGAARAAARKVPAHV